MTSSRQQSLIGLGGALGLHGALLAVLFLVEPAAPQVEALRPPVRIRVVDRTAEEKKNKLETKKIDLPVAAPADQPEVKKPDPPPKPEPKPKPKPKPKAKPKPKPKPVARSTPKKDRLAKVDRPKPNGQVPEARTEQPPADAPSAPPPRKARKFTVAMEATVPGGGVAVPTSAGQGWATGAPDGDPDGARIPGGSSGGDAAGQGDRKAPTTPRQAAEVSRLPRFLGGPSADEMRAAYPAEARREGREADVVLRILVSATGRVERVRLVRSAGEEFDAVALSLVERFRFSPGEEGGRAVAVWIPWTYKFRLEG